MKTLVIVLGIVGSLCALGLGSVWVTDYNKYKETMDSLASMPGAEENMAEFNNLGKAAYILIVGGLIGIVASLLVGKFGKISAGILIAIAIIPAIFAAKALVGTFLLLIAGGLAFRVKPTPDVVTA